MMAADFGSVLQGLDTVELSISGKSSGAQTTYSTAADQGVQSGSDARVEQLMKSGYDRQTATVIARDSELSKTDHTIMVYEDVLTPSDKQMLKQIQGNTGSGQWQDQRATCMLADTIAADRCSGKLKGDISASYIQTIKEGSAAGNANILEPDAVIPDSILSAAMSYIKAHQSDLSNDLMGQG